MSTIQTLPARCYTHAVPSFQRLGAVAQASFHASCPRRFCFQARNRLARRGTHGSGTSPAPSLVILATADTASSPQRWDEVYLGLMPLVGLEPAAELLPGPLAQPLLLHTFVALANRQLPEQASLAMWSGWMAGQRRNRGHRRVSSPYLTGPCNYCCVVIATGSAGVSDSGLPSRETNGPRHSCIPRDGPWDSRCVVGRNPLGFL